MRSLTPFNPNSVVLAVVDNTQVTFGKLIVPELRMNEIEIFNDNLDDLSERLRVLDIFQQSFDIDSVSSNRAVYNIISSLVQSNPGFNSAMTTSAAAGAYYRCHSEILALHKLLGESLELTAAEFFSAILQHLGALSSTAMTSFHGFAGGANESRGAQYPAHRQPRTARALVQ